MLLCQIARQQDAYLVGKYLAAFIVNKPAAVSVAVKTEGNVSLAIRELPLPWHAAC